MMRSPTLSQVKRHHLADTCCHCSAHAAVLGNRWCSQTFRDKQVSFAEPFAGVSVLLGSLVDRIMQFQRCWFSFIFFFFFKSRPSHQQAISSAFFLTVLWGASKRDSSSPFSLTHKYRQTHTPTHSFFLGVHVLSLLMSTPLSSSHFLVCFLTSRRG